MATILVATGYTTSPDGTRTPTYDTLTDVPCQIQALAYTDIQMLDGLQLNGERRKVYVNGHYDSLSRERSTGGDLLVFPDGTMYPFGDTWLIAQTLEQFPDWCSLAVTLQVSS